MDSIASTPVLILSGPPGAGKTTVARVLTGRYERAVHVESDRFFYFIQAGFIEPWKRESHRQNALIMQIVAAAAASYARAGYFTVIDGIVIPRWFLRTLQDALLSENVQVAYAVLRASKSTCIARAAGRHKERLPDADAVDQLWHEFANLGELEAHVLDTDELDPMQTADALAARLNKLLLRSERNTA